MKKSFVSIAVFILILFIGFDLSGQTPGSNDPTFNPYDIGFGNGDGIDGSVFTSCVQSNDKLIIGGGFTKCNGINRNSILRLNADCSVDTSFHIGTGANNNVFACKVQGDGKILIGGGFINFNGGTVNRITRRNVDGSIDTSFHSGTGADNFVRTFSIQNDGKIIVGGDFTTYFNPLQANRIVRINVNGTRDATFNIGTGFNSTVRSTAIQTDGKVIVAGDFTNYNGTSANRIIRLNTNGSIDTSFHFGTGANTTVSSAAIQSDGKIILAGNFTTYNGITVNRIVRLDINGSIDGTFISGTGTNNSISQVVIQNDGRIIIAGDFSSYDGTIRNRIVRLNTNGVIDNTFNVGSGANSSVSTISIQSDDKIVLAGSFSAYNDTAFIRFTHLNPNGSIVQSFDFGSGVNYTVYSTSIQNDGKIIIGGLFSKYNSQSSPALVRANSDGSVDHTFKVGLGCYGAVYSTAIQSDGKIIIAGNFTKYDTTFVNRIARLNIDGSIDTTFHPGSGADAYIRKVAIQSDGKILIVGAFTSYNGIPSNSIRRLNTDGTIDPAFNIGAGANGTLLSLAIQSDGKIIIAGYALFNNYNGTAINRIARLNANGSLDNSFSLGSGVSLPSPANYIYSIQLQSDGKIIPIGYYSVTTSTNYYSSIMRLNLNGNIDNTYNANPTGGNPQIFTSAIQSDDKLIIGGNFNNYNGTLRNSFARLNSNGTIDNTFNIGSGTDNYVNSISIQNDGKIIFAGDFTSYNSIGRNRIARADGDIVTGVNLMKNAVNKQPVIFPNPSNGLYSVIVDANYKMDIFDINGRLIMSEAIKEGTNQANLSNQLSGVYVLKLTSSTNNFSLKIIKE